MRSSLKGSVDSLKLPSLLPGLDCGGPEMDQLQPCDTSDPTARVSPPSLRWLVPWGTHQRSRSPRPLGRSGFTLLELMIVVSVISIVSAIVFPQYRRTLVLAEASTSILETVSFAAQCSVAHKSGLSTVLELPSGGSLNCNNTSARLISSRPWSGDASGVLCLGQPATVSHRQARIRVEMDGSMICELLP
jgi:type IV pilus assembly protein PilA